MASRERYVVGLDIGTSKVAAIVGEMMDDGSLEIIGIGVSESKGIRRGAVVNLEAAVDSIKHAVEEADTRIAIRIDEPAAVADLETLAAHQELVDVHLPPI